MRDFCNNPNMSEPSKPLEGVNALLSFTVENTYSYRDETEFSMTATRLAEKESRRDLKLAGRKNPIGVLPAAGIFGPNASGKTTILRAMADMRKMVIESFREEYGLSDINRSRFVLDPNSLDSPTSYAVDLVIEGIRWQYGFEINDDIVTEEYAYHYPRGRQARLFHRIKNELYFGTPLHGKKILTQMLNDNILLLSIIGVIKYSPVYSSLYKWFKTNLVYLDSYSRDAQIQQTAKRLEDHLYKSKILNFIRSADLGITDIRKIERDSVEIRKYRNIALAHRGTVSEAEIDTIDESTGTSAWIGFIGPVLDAIKRGSILLIDNLGGNLHPDLVSALIDIFQDKEKNPRCAQIVFNSHDITILDRHRSFMGRDQIWFTEKNIDGVSSLYSLSGFSPTPRREETPYRQYLKGRYGALPVLDESEIITALESNTI